MENTVRAFAVFSKDILASWSKKYFGSWPMILSTIESKFVLFNNFHRIDKNIVFTKVLSRKEVEKLFSLKSNLTFYNEIKSEFKLEKSLIYLN